MAKNNQAQQGDVVQNQNFTDKQKIAYYMKRVKDLALTESQRGYANNRVFQLSGGKKGVQSDKQSFNPQEKREHYRAVSRGQKATKYPSKFEPQRQKDYAKGQVDARDEAASIWGRKNFPNREERQVYGNAKYYRNGKEISSVPDDLPF